MVKHVVNEAWEENFLKDVERIEKEIFVNLNANVSKEQQFFMEWYGNRCLILKKGEITIYIEPITPTPNPKVKYGIKLDMLEPAVQKKGNSIINVSHRDQYTKQELERAKNQILAKIYNFLGI